MPVATVSIPDFSPSVCSISRTQLVNSFTSRCGHISCKICKWCKVHKKSVELFSMKVALSVLGIPLMWHLLPSASALLTFKALPWIPAMQKGQHFPSKCIPTGQGSESGWANGQNLQAVWELLPKPAACPPQGGKGILALLPLAHDDSSDRKRNPK